MSSLVESAVRRPLTVILVVIAVTIFGFISVQQLPLLFLPNIESPSLRVTVPYSNSSPDIVVNEVSVLIEGAIGGMDGLESIRSTSSSTRSTIYASFLIGTEMDLTIAEARNRIDRIRSELPKGIGRIRISNFSTADIPIIQLAVASDGTRKELQRVTENVVIPTLLRLDGVADVEVRGLRTEKIFVTLSSAAMSAYALSFDDVIASLRDNNVDTAGGYIEDGSRRYFIRVLGTYQSLEKIENIKVSGVDEGAATIKIKDIGRVEISTGNVQNIRQLNLNEAVTIRVFKNSTANVVKVARAARQQMKYLEKANPGLTTFVFFDQSAEIMTSLINLRNSGIVGAGLAIIVLYIFLLRLRATFLIAVSIPVSVVATFTVVFLIRRIGGVDFTLNIISLSGLMLAVGMLVDNSVVVLENIHRHRELGLSSNDAAVKGTKEVSTPVIAATLTSVIVFIPVLFTSATPFGRYIADFAATIVAAMVASLLVSLSLIPVLSSKFLIYQGVKRKNKLFIILTSLYLSLLRWTLKNRLLTLLIMLAVLGGGIYLLTKIEREFLPQTPARRISVQVEAENGVGLIEIQRVVNDFQRKLLDNKKELEINSVSANLSTRGGSITIYFLDDDTVEKTIVKLTGEIRQILPDEAGFNFSVGRRYGRGGSGGLGVSVDLMGPDTEILSLFADDIRLQLSQIPGVEDVETTLTSGDEQLHVLLNRDRSSLLQLSALDIGSALFANLSESSAGKFSVSGRQEIPIILRMEEKSQVDVGSLGTFSVAQNSKEALLGTVAQFKQQKGPADIRRQAGSDIVSVSANSDRSGVVGLQSQIKELLNRQKLPPGYSAKIGENFRRFRESEKTSFFALLLASLFIYLVMAALFESFLHPITILMSLPFSIIGVAILFWATGNTLNTSSWLGVMVLFGVVVNNGIILVDHINRMRLKGASRDEAILLSGRDRLRPILITAITTILGLLPLVAPLLAPAWFGPVEGRAGLWGPIALSLIGGLTTSTFMTLVVMPTIYSLIDDLSHLTGRLWRAITA